MPLSFDKLAVTHVERDEFGNKIEPEEQAVVQLGSVPISVNLGVADFERKNGGRPIITKENVATLQHAGTVKRTVSAFQAAKDEITRCSNCRFMDVDVLQNKSRNQHADDTRIAVAAGLIKIGRTPHDAEVEARTAGRCHQLDGIVLPWGTCDRFKPHSRLNRAIAFAKDMLMRAAQGRRD